jgi:hypothetical protein
MMKLTLKLFYTSLLFVLALNIGYVRAQTNGDQTNSSNRSAAANAEFQFSNLLVQARPSRRAGFRLMHARFNVSATGPVYSIMPAAANQNYPVTGNGAAGRLTKWMGFTSSNAFIGNSTIYEDKNGLVGIGTDSPTSRLTVMGLIESKSGGFKFPDGTVQTTSSTGSLFSVAHDATLTGDGTAASPLAVAVPLNLSGAIGGGTGVLNVTNTNANAIVAIGGPSDNFSGIRSIGGDNTGNGGRGITATGGDSETGFGGSAILAFGGTAQGLGPDPRRGGTGLIANGGLALGVGNTGGTSLTVSGGPGIDGAAQGIAASFFGDVEIDGDISSTGNVTITGDVNVTGTKNFRIDHPLDPENKYLFHAAIESSEVLNVYSGNIITDANGYAVVALPDWFESINKDLRYQLTVIGTFAQAIVAEKVKGNRFRIKTNAPNVEVSWQVTGVRSDAAMLKHPFKAEQTKP